MLSTNIPTNFTTDYSFNFSTNIATNFSIPISLFEIPPTHLVMMLIGYLSMILYIWIVIVILINRKNYYSMQSAFYGLLLNQAFADLCMFLTIELIMRPRKFRLFSIFTPQEHSLFAKISYFAMVTTRSTMFLGYLPIALNRFTIFFCPLLYKRLWTQKTVNLCALFQWLLPLIVNVYFYFIMQSQESIVLLPNGFLQLVADHNTSIVNSVQVFVTGVLVTVICAALYAWTLTYVRKSVKMSNNAIIYETRLFICASVTFLPMLLEAMRSIVQLIGHHVFHSQSVFLACAEIFFYTAEFASITQPWTILFTNRLIRSFLWKSKRRSCSPAGTPFTYITPFTEKRR